MNAMSKGGAFSVMGVLEALHVTNPPLFEKLIGVLAARPDHGEIVLRFRDGKLFLVERHDSYR